MQAAASFLAVFLSALAGLMGAGEPHASPPGRLLAADPIPLAGTLSQTQRTIDDPASSPAALQGAGQMQQLATLSLGRARGAAQRAVLAALRGRAAGSLRADLTAAAALARLNPPVKSLPRWRIAAPPAPGVLLGDFEAAEARYGVPWQYLAAIELIETDFGRVIGLSPAGAEGPMQFVPATWAEYGTGDVHNQRAAIFAAARYLAANGAPSDMAGAVYHYNLSRDYVSAVRAYAGRMTADPRAFFGYYYWQVILARRGGLVLLPVGFPHDHAVPLAPS